MDTGRKVLWQLIRPKEQVGLHPMFTPVNTTPDGRWIAFTYGTQIGQLYATEGLK